MQANTQEHGPGSGPGSGNAGVFQPGDDLAYARWRAEKLALYPRVASELVVPVADAAAPTAAERAAVLAAVARCNMAVVRLTDSSSGGGTADLRPALTRLMQAFGLVNVEAHRSAETDGFVEIAVSDTPQKRGFIPYTARAIGWHTDGYYNPPETPIKGMLLHCIRAATTGGENAVLDPEIAYIRLRDANPAWLAALMHPGAMLIPAAVEDDGRERPASVGPVFLVDSDGALVMRYTGRGRNITWRDDADTRAAVEFLASLLRDEAEPLILKLRLAPGEGLLCNNVLHSRTGFAEVTGAARLLLRARFTTRLRDAVSAPDWQSQVERNRE